MFLFLVDKKKVFQSQIPHEKLPYGVGLKIIRGKILVGEKFSHFSDKVCCNYAMRNIASRFYGTLRFS